MKHTDDVYGEIEITEPVLIDLIDSPALQRLKGVDQGGHFEHFFPGTSHSRFVHSLGVMCLLRMFGASLEEQIAGLIHDVSHSAFSHTIDYIVDGDTQTQSHQDDIMEEFVKKTDIPSILAKHGIDIDFILNDDNFPLKERPLPDLCADRIDYSLRTAIIHGILKKDEVMEILNNLEAKDGRWVFSDFETAMKYSRTFSILNERLFSGLASAMVFRTTGDCMKYALEKGYITMDDLYTTDNAVLEKIRANLDDDVLNALFERMNRTDAAMSNPDDYDVEIFCKSRVVDPLFMSSEGIRRVSEKDSEWAEHVKAESVPKRHLLKFT